MRNKLIILHPYLAGIYFVLDGFVQFASYVPLYMLLLPFVIVILFTLFLNLSVRAVVKDKIKSAIITTVILIPLLFCSKFMMLFRDICYRFERIDYVIIVTGLLAALCILFIIKTKKKLFSLNSYLNILFIAYTLYGIVAVATHMKPYDNSLESQIYKEGAYGKEASINQARVPDIYYLVFDSYTSSDSLKEYWGYDNSGFENNLKKRGFYVAKNSLSFGPETLSSISSALNMSNDPRLVSIPEEIKLKLIENNLVTRILYSQAYRFINLSPFNIINIPRLYEYGFIGYVGSGPRYFISKVFNSTMIFQVVLQLNHAYVYKENAKIIDLLEKIPQDKTDSPRFIYAHLMLPHRPFCFDRNGKFIPWFKQGAFDKKAYLEQLIYTNQIILKLADTLISKSKNAPIIIIQGDHGFRFIGDLKNYEHESLTIMNAYYLPNSGEKLLYPGFSPFNTFRIIFNYYFGASYKLLEDKKS